MSEDETELTENGRTARAAYLRSWREKNPGKQKLYSERYWNKRADNKQKVSHRKPTNLMNK